MTDPSERAIRLEAEVPGTPEQVWEAVATGPGITSWFVPAQVEGRVGGRVAMSFGPGMDTAGVVTAWEPPHRFAYRSDGMPLAYEYTVEARDGGTCIVRLVNSGFGEGAEWDAEIGGMEAGWRLFLNNLRLYLTHFPGQAAVPVLVNGTATGGVAGAWPRLLDGLGLKGAPAEGDEVVTGDPAPHLAGVADRVADGMLTVVAEEPAPAVALFAVEGAGDGVATSFYCYFFGPAAAAAAAGADPVWRAWMAATFPS
jgi:uncharacterized protein YndB with AHSA1/START domain